MRSYPVSITILLATGIVPLVFSRPSVAQSSDAKEPILADSASFSEPKGWIRLKPDKAKTKGWFISPDSDRAAPKSMIMVDIGKTAEVSLASAAEKMARNWGGCVLEEKTTLDGAEAIRVRVAKPGPGLRPVEGVVTLRGEKIYLVMGGVIPGQVVTDQVEEVRKSWKWIKSP